MPAPKGNKNGLATRFTPLTSERTVQVGARVPESQAMQIDSLLKPGQSRSDWLREAIRRALANLDE